MCLMRRSFRRRWTLSEAIVLVLAAIVILYAVYLLAIGPVLSVLPEGASTASSVRTPTWTGIIPAVGGALIVAGTLLRRYLGILAGVVITAVYSALYLFGAGGMLIPVAVGLIVMLPSARKGNQALVKR
jgi:hypothetical protein